MKEVDGLIAEGKLVPHPITVGINGLHGILDAQVVLST
jgi:hypothetical protein